MIPRKLYKQYGIPMKKPKGIVIHNTNVQKSAKELEEWMVNNKSSNGCHYFVDADEVRQVMPLTWSAFNTGKGFDFGNTECIVVEVCSDLNGTRYQQGEDRAIKLIRELMNKYRLTAADIYFHRDFDPNINCPAQILKRYGSKQNFLKENDL